MGNYSPLLKPHCQQALLYVSADLHAVDIEGRTPLDYASQLEGGADTVALLQRAEEDGELCSSHGPPHTYQLYLPFIPASPTPQLTPTGAQPPTQKSAPSSSIVIITCDHNNNNSAKNRNTDGCL